MLSRRSLSLLGALVLGALASVGSTAGAWQGPEDDAARRAAHLSDAGSAPSATILIAGDIASCTSSGDTATARLLLDRPGIVMTAGDNAYPSGTLAQFRNCYGPTWGRVLDRTRPAPGNHDWGTIGAAGYHRYFGRRAGPEGRGYYTFRAGTWRVYVLDTTRCFVGDPRRSSCASESAQYRWLAAHLAEHPASCVLAVGHHPRFSSGAHGSALKVRPLIKLLYAAGADLVVNGHDHIYERFAPARPDGTPDAEHGIRQFIVGTGGSGRYALRSEPVPHSEVRDNRYYGVLRLELTEAGYGWRFLRAGGGVGDRGSGACHGRPGSSPAGQTAPEWTLGGVRWRLVRS